MRIIIALVFVISTAGVCFGEEMCEVEFVSKHGEIVENELDPNQIYEKRLDDLEARVEELERNSQTPPAKRFKGETSWIKFGEAR